MSRSCIDLILAAASCLLLAACAKDSEDRLAAEHGGVICDTTSVRYSADIVPILQENCYSCHGQNNSYGSGGVILEGHDSLTVWAKRGYLRGVVTHAAGFVAMPYGKPTLPDCEMNKIIAWIDQGEADN